VLLREAGGDDAGAIAAVQVHGWQAAYRGQLPDDYLDALDVEARERAWRDRLGTVERDVQSFTLVVEDAGRVVGFVTAGPTRDPDAGPRTAEVYAIYVAPERLREGFGRALLTGARQALSIRGFSVVTLWVLETNRPAIAFYEEAGWHDDGSRSPQSIDGLSLPSVRYRVVLA
jgi:ribosomal protein S18 acetylase RimI-like enzyme